MFFDRAWNVENVTEKALVSERTLITAVGDVVAVLKSTTGCSFDSFPRAVRWQRVGLRLLITSLRE